MADDPGGRASADKEQSSAVLIPTTQSAAVSTENTPISREQSAVSGVKTSTADIKPELRVSPHASGKKTATSGQQSAPDTNPQPTSKTATPLVSSGKSAKTPQSTRTEGNTAKAIGQEKTAREEGLFPQDENEDGQKWYQSIDWSPFLDICLWSAVLDPSQAQLLHEYSRVFGGVYFLLAYFVLAYAIQLPLTFVLLHWGQSSQMGLSTVTYHFGRAFRALGYAMIAWHVVHQGILVKEAAVQLGHNMMMEPHLDYFIQCYARDTDCRLNCDRPFCCSSLKTTLICNNRDDPECRKWIAGTIDDEHRAMATPGCRDRTDIEMFRNKPAASLYLKSDHLPADLPLGTYANVAMTLMVVGCVAVAGLGNPTFYIIYACLGMFTVCLVLFHCGILLVTGSLMTGLNRLIRLSQVQHFCSIEVVYALYNALINPVNLKFFVVSMASFRKKRRDAYSMAAQMTLAHLLLSVLFLAANVAMTARLDTDGNRYGIPVTSHPSVADVLLHKRDEFWQSIVPEFYSTYDQAASYSIFALMLFCLHLMPILGPFFTLCELKRHHDNLAHPRPVANILFACLMGGAVLYVAGVTLKYPTVAGRWHGVVGHCFGGILLLLFYLVTVHLYGSGEFYVDLCFFYPVTKTVHSRYIPQSKVFRFLLRVVVPLVLLTLLLFQLRLNFTFDQNTDESGWGPVGLLVESVLPILPLLVLLTVFALDLGRWIGALLLEAVRGYSPRPDRPAPFEPVHLQPSYIIQEKEKHD